MADVKGTSRRNFLRGAAMTSGALVAGAGAMESAGAEPVKAVRPNVLMICADQFRADFVGANHANPTTKTPHIDALAARGTNFQQAVCNQPLCSPSRASFMTGMTATKVGVWKLGLELGQTAPSVATVLGKAGYTTAFMGKWHVSATGADSAAKDAADAPGAGGVR
jgi:arylsulfatase A-like enzyme